MDIKTNGFYDRQSGNTHIFIPPSPTESERGGIKAKMKTTETVEVAIGDDEKLYVPSYPTSLPASDVSDWAKASTKPSYTAEEVGALPNTTNLLQLDDTLTDENKAANAKVTGDKLLSLDENKVDKSVILSIINKRPTVETLDDFFALQRTPDIYQTKVYKSSYNPTPTCEKLGANTGLVCEPSTDTVEGQDDYADKIEFMWWHCNYVYDEYGNKIVTAIEGDENYSETGTVDVGTIGMTFYYSWDKSNDEYQMLSWSTSPDEALGLTPYDYSVMHDGTIRSYYVLSAYPSTLGSDGLLHSQPNGKLARLQSYNNMITNYGKKGKNITGAKASRNTFQIIFNFLKYGTKDSQSIYKGVTNWNFQYSAAVERDTTDTYFPVTASQANNLEVGCYVSVGYAGVSSGKTSTDRGQVNVHTYADDVKILRIEDMDDGNKAVYLDIDTGFTTTPVDLGDGLSSPVYISSMHMWTGETNKVIGKHDGSAVSNTNGHHSYRVQGIEYALGAYIVASDVVIDFQSDYSKNVYVAPRGVVHSMSIDTIRSTYKLVGNIPASANGNGSDWNVGDIDIDPETGAWYPSLEVAGSTQGFCDRVYAGSATTSGQREYLQGGFFWLGSCAGSACLYCWYDLSYACWHFCGCD